MKKVICLACGSEITFPNVPLDPKENDYAGCIMCGGQFRFNADLSLRRMEQGRKHEKGNL